MNKIETKKNPCEGVDVGDPVMGSSRYPSSFKKAKLRSILPIDGEDMGISFDMENGGVVRMIVPVSHMESVFPYAYEALKNAEIIDSITSDAEFVMTINKDTMILKRMHGGIVVESYAPVSKERGAVYLAAISQGFQPPRDLRLFDKPVD